MSGKRTIGEIAVKSDQDVEWKIPGILSRMEKKQSYSSRNFTLSNYQWRFQMVLYSEYMLWQLEPCDLSWVGGVAYSLGVKNSDGKITKIISNVIWIHEDQGPNGYPVILKRSEFAERKSELAPSDTFTLTYTFLRVCDDFDSIGETSSMSDNLLEMFTSQKACDVTLQVKQETFAVHKFILMARSPVFAAMFEAPMKEKAKGVVGIEDCDPEAFRDFLMYLYSGRLEKFSRHMIELYKIADKYIIQDLKIDCVIAMMGNLSIENVTDVLSLAERSNEGGLTWKAQTFFNKNYVEILLSRKWETFMKEEQELAHKLLRNMANDHSGNSDILFEAIFINL